MPSLTRGPAERELQRLIELFLQAETDIINEIGRLRSLGLADYHAEAALERVQAILRKLGFSREQFGRNLEDCSGGQKKKVLIAASLCEQAHLYVWDEPLNFLDIDSRLQIEELLRGFAPTMIFVEHDRAFQEAIATKVIAL